MYSRNSSRNIVFSASWLQSALFIWRAPFGRTRDKSLLTLAQAAPAASAPPLCVHAPPFGSVRLHPLSTRSPFFPVLLSLFRRSAPYESGCFHPKPTKQRFFFAREMPVSGFDRKIRAKWRQSCVGKRCRNSEYPSSKRDFRHGTHLPESQKK